MNAPSVKAAAGVVMLFLLTASLIFADVEDQYTEWSAPVNLGFPVNSLVVEQQPAISKDGLSLYFNAQNRSGGFGGQDIWVSRRASVNDPWGEPENLGPTINTAANEAGPFLSIDGHRLFFHSNRPGGFGNADIYVSRRHNKRDDFGWRPPANLGPGVNTNASEVAPAYFEDDGTGVITLYFQSDRLGGLGGNDIYASTLQADETFGPAVLVEELSSPFDDGGVDIRRDGLEAFLASNRPGGFGFMDIWVSTRSSTSDPWGEPQNVEAVNAMGNDAGSALSFDGTALYFHSTREGGVGPCGLPGSNPCFFDLWVTTRAKLKADE